MNPSPASLPIPNPVLPSVKYRPYHVTKPPCIPRFACHQSARHHQTYLPTYQKSLTIPLTGEGLGTGDRGPAEYTMALCLFLAEPGSPSSYVPKPAYAVRRASPGSRAHTHTHTYQELDVSRPPARGGLLVCPRVKLVPDTHTIYATYPPRGTKSHSRKAGELGREITQPLYLRG